MRYSEKQLKAIDRDAVYPAEFFPRDLAHQTRTLIVRLRHARAAFDKWPELPPRPATAGQDESVRDGDGGEEQKSP